MKELGRLCVLLAGLLCAGRLVAGAAGDGLIPFLAITGRPTEQAVRAKVAAMQASGIESFLIYARSGLELAYMGEDWLRLNEWFCDEAERRGMKVWLYDEYNWPSGTCRGRVPGENDAWRYAELGVFRNPDGSYRWTRALAPGGWVNVCEPDAVRRFIALTHDVYARRLRRWFENKTILGIFTDEPGHPTRVTFEEGTPLVSFRDFSGLEEAYLSATGRALRADVEAWLDVKASDPAAAKKSPAADVWSVYAEIMGRRFRAAYFDQIRAWCDAHGILFTGHMISEDYLPSSARCNGNPVLCLRGESLPGMDEIHTAYLGDDSSRSRIEWVTYNVARQAILHRGRGGLVELFACGPADHVPATLRHLFWQCAFHGIDHYITCMDVMDERGLVEKHGYLSCAGPVHPWYEKQARPLVDEARVAAAWARKTVAAREVAVRYPNAAAARAAHTGAPSPKLRELLKALELGQFTCRLLDTDEKTDLPLVFACAEGGLFSEMRTGASGLTADAALALCRRTLPASFEVLERDGTVAGQLLVRVYSDGTAAVLNMLPDGERTLVATRAGARTTFRLPGRGVKLFAHDELPAPASACVSIGSLADAAWTLSLGGPTVRRVNFDASKNGAIRVAESVPGARLVARDLAVSYAVTESGRPVGLHEKAPKGEKVLVHAAEPYSFEMDGRRVLAPEACGLLPSVYNSLYRQTASFDLAAGTHAVRIAAGEADQNFYLPALFVAGDFEVRADGALAPRRTGTVPLGSLASLGLGDFAGVATWRAEVRAPTTAGARLRLATGGRLARVMFRGRDPGVRAGAPFDWAPPPDLAGASGALEVEVYTSCMPLFGDVDAGKWDMRFWCDVHCADGPCGLFAVEWVADRP